MNGWTLESDIKAIAFILVVLSTISVVVGVCFIDEFERSAYWGTVIGSGFGLIALLLGALFNADLNRRRDDRIRREQQEKAFQLLIADIRVFIEELIGVYTLIYGDNKPRKHEILIDLLIPKDGSLQNQHIEGLHLTPPKLTHQILKLLDQRSRHEKLRQLITKYYASDKALAEEYWEIYLQKSPNHLMDAADHNPLPIMINLYDEAEKLGFEIDSDFREKLQDKLNKIMARQAESKS
ncbi:MAG: hypothetical protein AB8B77_00160 [Alphaproteobacteria bacterium]